MGTQTKRWLGQEDAGSVYSAPSGLGLMSPVTGRLFGKFGGKWLAVGGFALIIATGAAVLSFVGAFFVRYSHGEETDDRVKVKVEPPRSVLDDAPSVEAFVEDAAWIIATRDAGLAAPQGTRGRVETLG